MAQEKVTRLKSLRVTSESEEANLTAPQPQKVSKEYMENLAPTDVGRALKQVPGVYVREEDGLGLRPNIGLRGTNPDRSKTITILEDSVLSGPSPYSAPAQYYTPNLLQTESIEVAKGFKAIGEGPNSVGGAINYVSRQWKGKNWSKLQANYGSFSSSIFSAINESTWNEGRSSVLLQGSLIESDGFKTVPLGFPTDIHKNILLLKARHLLNSEGTQVLGFKYEYSDEDSKETYLGMTRKDFLDHPYERYLASQKDEMVWHRNGFQLDYSVQISAEGFLKISAYQNRFSRVWARFDRFKNGPDVFDVLRDPTGANLDFLNVLKGSLDSNAVVGGQLIQARNERRYISEGVQAKLEDSVVLGEVRHDLQAFARLHFDQIERFHTHDVFDMQSGRLQITSERGVMDTFNKDAALATTVFLQDQIKWQKWMFILASRFEDVNFSNKDSLNILQKNRHDQVFIPGASIGYRWSEDFTQRLSVNRGATLALADNSGQKKRQESLNYEFESAFVSREYDFSGDLVLFINDYQNITGICSDSTGCNPQQLDSQFSGGKALVRGAELRLAKSYALGEWWFPIQLNASFLQAEFKNSFQSSSSEWGVGSIKTGDPLPYIPQSQYSLMVGSEFRKWKQDLVLNYTGAFYDQSVEAGRIRLAGYGILDWVHHYQMSDQHRLSFKAENLLAKEYAVSFRPFGFRPGKPQSFMMTYTWTP